MGGKATLNAKNIYDTSRLSVSTSNNGILAGRRRRGTKPSKTSS